MSYFEKALKRLGFLVIVFAIAAFMEHTFKGSFNLFDRIDWLIGASWAIILFTESDENLKKNVESYYD